MSAGKRDGKGMKLRTLNLLMIVAAAFISFLLFMSTRRIFTGFEAMQTATDTYIQSQADAADLQSGSDYLTEQVRYYTVTGDPVYMENYFTEAEVTRRRDNAIASMEQIVDDTAAYDHLKQALAYSDELMEVEYEAFLLVLDAYEILRSDYPEALRSLTLPEEDMALDARKKREKAVRIVFDDNYQAYKQNIYYHVGICQDELISTTKTMQGDRVQSLQTSLRSHVYLLSALLFLFMSFMAAIAFLVIRPLLRCVSDVLENKKMVPGSLTFAELHFLADSYNEIFDIQHEEQEKLSYEATHDGLTGLLNRTAYEQFKHHLGDTSCCYLMIDLDDFKHINDNYGHDTGDLVLKKVADVLKHHFRSEDMIYRLGGDEFAVTMVRVGRELRPLVERKLTEIGKDLAAAADGLPAATLSIGAAFSDDCGNEESVAKAADIALYQVKNSGKKGYGFYEPQV